MTDVFIVLKGEVTLTVNEGEVRGVFKRYGRRGGLRNEAHA